MMRTMFVWAATCSIWPFANAFPHDGHGHDQLEQDGTHVITLAQQTSSAEASSPADGLSGQGELKFRVLHTSDHLPEVARRVIERAHGGFAVDRREGRGEIYFALPEAGILQIGKDFGLIRMLSTPPEVRETNMHNTTVWFDAEDNGYLAFPANDAGMVFTTSMDGSLKHSLGTPTSEIAFDADAVNRYFSENGRFVPTDVEYVGGKYFVTTGYSKLDYVLSADVTITKPNPASESASQAGPSVSAAWTPLAFGGKGDAPGQLGTGHGVTLAPDGTTLLVADRPYAEIDQFSQSGEYTGTVNLPKGSFPCDIDFEAGYAVVGCLHGPDRSKGAPIYILRDDKVVSTIMPKEELGLKNFQHIHNAVLVERKGKLYIIAQAWNPGDFAILEQVTDELEDATHE